MDNKYKEGDVVYAKINPTLKLVVRRYSDRIYYCTIKDYPGRKEKIYFEGELVDADTSGDLKTQ